MAGNKNSGRRPGGKDFAPRMRSAIDRVLAKLEEGGDIDKLLEAAIREDIVGAMAALAKYAPQQIEAKIEGASLSDYVLAQAAKRRESSAADSVH